jgi:hypothetical protein
MVWRQRFVLMRPAAFLPLVLALTVSAGKITLPPASSGETTAEPRFSCGRRPPTGN